MNLAKFSIFLTACVYCVIGMMFLISPVYWAKGIDIEPLTPTAIIDLQATYGGCMLALGVFFIYCLKNAGLIRVGLILQAITLGGFGVGRILGIAVYGMPRPVLFYLLAAEVSGVLLAIYCLSQLKE
jgi:hypothetical protein